MAPAVDAELPAAYNRLRVGIGLYDPSTGRVLDANDHLESLFGYDGDVLRRMTVDAYSANTYSLSRAEFSRRLSQAADGTPQQFKWRVKRADGTLIWVRFHLSRITLDESVYVVAEIHDVSDYYTANRRVCLLSRLLRHNLRNDVNVITAYTQQIESIADTEQVRRIAASARATAMGLSEMTESVKAIEHATTATDATGSARDVASTVREVAGRFETAYPSAEIDVVEANQMRFHVDTAFDHAMSHALENAIVHAETSEPRVEVTVDASPNTGRVEIRIADTNPPIPDIEIDALSEFAETTSTDHGSGVGLFVMKWCIESLGGELAFETRQPRGNVVYFYLPSREHGTPSQEDP